MELGGLVLDLAAWAASSDTWNLGDDLKPISSLRVSVESSALSWRLAD
ncbi:MAG: hypothetical protein JWQ49_583 [Edaphobacter sp.]|nr:hypothetical protein [Edaphobacter sp.]